ncbi:endonuclease domain-containing protein [Streptomyces sp. NPDC092295]|uniref:endonuclease domain-containing protein n=1 Tax=Streptomyces sp. NPDC092295 TaxID=3366011 RepID=UPI00382D198B
MYRGNYGIPISADTLMDCDQCGVTYKYGVRGRVRGHCLSCSPMARQARRHNLTVKDVIAILEVQGHVCALCGRGPEGGGGRSYWCIDHDHNCCYISQGWRCGGCVRGLLCNGCNVRGVAWYENLPHDRRDWQRMNDYLANPPADRCLETRQYRIPALGRIRQERPSSCL